MVLSIPIYRVTDVHAEKQQLIDDNSNNTRTLLPLMTPSPPTTSSSSFSSGHLVPDEETVHASSSSSGSFNNKESHYTPLYDQQQEDAALISPRRKEKQSSLAKQPPSLSSTSSSHRYTQQDTNNKRRYFGSLMDHSDAAYLGIPKSSKSTGTTTSISTIGSDASFKTAISRQETSAQHFIDTMPSTPPHTTVSPNDNDEGLYLLWTHQLLRERGFNPSPCRLKQEDGIDILTGKQQDESFLNRQVDDYDDDYDSDDTKSTDSSLTQGDKDSSLLLLTSPESIDYESKMRMYSSFNSCASSFNGQQQDYFHHRPSASSSMHHSSFASTSARYGAANITTKTNDEDDEGETISSFFKSFFGTCFSCNNGHRSS